MKKIITTFKELHFQSCWLLSSQTRDLSACSERYVFSWNHFFFTFWLLWFPVRLKVCPPDALWLSSDSFQRKINSDGLGNVFLSLITVPNLFVVVVDEVVVLLIIVKWLGKKCNFHIEIIPQSVELSINLVLSFSANLLLCKWAVSFSYSSIIKMNIFANLGGFYPVNCVGWVTIETRYVDCRPLDLDVNLATMYISLCMCEYCTCLKGTQRFCFLDWRWSSQHTDRADLLPWLIMHENWLKEWISDNDNTFRKMYH